MKTDLCLSMTAGLLAPGHAPAQPDPAAMKAIDTAYGVFAVKTNDSLWEMPWNHRTSADGTHLGPAFRITVDCDGPWMAVADAYSGRDGTAASRPSNAMATFGLGGGMA